MITRAILSTLVFGLAIGTAGTMTGCGGPTKAGKEARAAAGDRMNLISAQVNYDQARQAFETGQFEKANREIRNAITRFDKSPDFFLLQGRIHLETHQLELAVESFKKSIELKPEYAAPHYFRGIVYQRWSDDEEAYKNYAKAYELEPTKVQYLLAAAESLIVLGEIDAAAELIAPKLNYFEHNSAIKQLQGEIALLKGDAKAAASMYAEARLLSPDDAMLLEELMWAQYAAEMYGQCHESIKLLQDRTKEKRADLIHLEARCLSMMGRGSEARELYIQLSKLRPSDPIVWSELGTLAWDLGDYRRVANCSVQMIALAPDRYEGYMFKGLNERQRGNTSEAVKFFREAADRATDVALPHLLLGQALLHGGDVKGAALAYNDAMTAEPGNAEAQELLRRLDSGQRITAAPTE